MGLAGRESESSKDKVSYLTYKKLNYNKFFFYILLRKIPLPYPHFLKLDYNHTDVGILKFFAPKVSITK